MPSDLRAASAPNEVVFVLEQENWENEGGHMSCSAGRVSFSAGTELPYRAVLTRPQGQPLYRSFATMREAEAFIRRNTPVPARALSTLYDRPAEAVGQIGVAAEDDAIDAYLS
jgi:hypothetical protein